jgi:tyrosine-protein phosphatase YwqE
MENELGYSELWFTPHVMADLHNTAEKMKQRFDEVIPAYKGNMDIHLSSEYMMDADFAVRLQTDPLLLGKDHLLVETSYMNCPNNMEEILLSVWNSGYHPLIAHPERYMYMDEDDYWSLKDKGYEFQLNLMSLSGYYGGRPKYVAQQLLEEDFYDFVGSDLHHLERYRPMLRHLKLTTKQLDKLEELLENNSRI